jgi:multicomponent Na+:H+ antiporter subunit G
MIETAQFIIAGLLFLLGSFFFLVGVLGLLRMPDVFSRIHTTTKGDTLGVGLILLGIIVLYGFNLTSLRVLVLLVLVWVTTPTAAHLIAKAEYSKGAQK